MKALIVTGGFVVGLVVCPIASAQALDDSFRKSTAGSHDANPQTISRTDPKSVKKHIGQPKYEDLQVQGAQNSGGSPSTATKKPITFRAKWNRAPQQIDKHN
jgi:hypothetical protein